MSEKKVFGLPQQLTTNRGWALRGIYYPNTQFTRHLHDVRVNILNVVVLEREVCEPPQKQLDVIVGAYVELHSVVIYSLRGLLGEKIYQRRIGVA